MTQLTTTGLRPDGTSETELPPVAWGIATGSANAIAVTYDPEVTGLTDGLILGFRALAANTAAATTFNPSALGAKTVVKGGGQALLPGDIPGLDADVLVRYNKPDDRWELLNPYRNVEASSVSWAVAGGTADAIEATFSPALLSLEDGQIVGVRASGANTIAGVTFSPNGLTARTVKKYGNQALLVGDIYGANHELLLRYHASGTRWELLNPYWRPEYTALLTQDPLFKYLAADDTGGQNINTAQPWFPTAGAVSLEASTLYEFDGHLILSRSSGTNSHSTSVLFGGSATLTGIFYRASSRTGDANSLAADHSVFGDSAAAVQVKAASTSGSEQASIDVHGYVRTNAAGTFIPQFQYNNSPGGAPTIKNGSFFRLTKKGTSATTTQGTWA